MQRKGKETHIYACNWWLSGSKSSYTVCVGLSGAQYLTCYQIVMNAWGRLLHRIFKLDGPASNRPYKRHFRQIQVASHLFLYINWPLFMMFPKASLSKMSIYCG